MDAVDAKFLPITVICDAEGNEVEGFQVEDIKHFLNEQQFDDFCAFLAGQEVKIAPDGSSLVPVPVWDKFANREIPVVEVKENDA